MPPATTPAPTRSTRRRTALVRITPVCDGCRRTTSIGGWNPGTDGTQLCHACAGASLDVANAATDRSTGH